MRLQNSLNSHSLVLTGIMEFGVESDVKSLGLVCVDFSNFKIESVRASPGTQHCCVQRASCGVVHVASELT